MVTEQIYEIRVSLIHSKPPIWRRVAVPASITLAELHDVLQAAFDWTNSHLHQFESPQRRPKLTPKEIAALAAGEEQPRNGERRALRPIAPT